MSQNGIRSVELDPIRSVVLNHYSESRMRLPAVFQ